MRLTWSRWVVSENNSVFGAGRGLRIDSGKVVSFLMCVIVCVWK